MKRLFEFTDAELLALDADTVQRLIDLECAHEGAPLLPPDPGFAPTHSLPEPDTTAYEILGICFTDAEFAANLLRMFNESDMFNDCYPGSDYNSAHRYLTPITPGSYQAPKIETKKVYSPALWDHIKDDYLVYKGQRDAYNKLRKEYDEAVKARQDVSEAVYDRLREAQNARDMRETLRSKFLNYVDLAEGNRSVALTFLEKAEPNLRADFPDLIAEFTTVPELNVKLETAV